MTKQQKDAARKALASYWAGSASESIRRDIQRGRVRTIRVKARK